MTTLTHDHINTNSITDQHRIRQNKIDVVQVIGIQLEFSPHGDEVTHLESARVLHEIHFSHRLWASPTAKETLAHGEFGYDNVVVPFGSKGHIKTFKCYLLSLEFFNICGKGRVV